MGILFCEAKMAYWILECPHCNKEFTHSEISTGSFVADPFTMSVVKPEFPSGGLSVVCPCCKIATVHQRHELIYRAS